MENLYEKATQLARVGIWEWEPATNEVKWYGNKFKLFGYEPNEFEITLDTAFKTVHPDDVSSIFQLLEEKLPVEDLFDYEYRGIKKDGSQIYIWVCVEVERDKEGNPSKVIGISQDISRRRQLENDIKQLNGDLEQKVKDRTKALEQKSAENELLVKEMHHRVKNNLQLISSILNLQQHHLVDIAAKEILELCVKRIKSIATIHDSLYKNNDLVNIDLEFFINQLIEVHQKAGLAISLDIKVDNKIMAIDQMVPIGIILNELVSNSTKYGFSGRNDGKISIDIKNSDKLAISYKDNGNGFEKQTHKESGSFGLELIDIICEDLGCTYTLSADKGKGMTFHCSN